MPSLSILEQAEQKASSFFNAQEFLDLNKIDVQKNAEQRRIVSTTKSSNPGIKKATKRIAVIGSRNFKSLDLIDQWLDYARDKWDGNVVIVSGGTRGVDKKAEQWAIERKINRDIFVPSSQDQGKKAGILRNKQIVENADFILAFWDEESTGTESTLNYAKKIGKPCIIVMEDGFHKKW